MTWSSQGFSCWWCRVEYLVKLPLKVDVLVLTPEIEPTLVYMFILAFDVSHGKWGYLFPEEGGECESTVSPSQWHSTMPQAVCCSINICWSHIQLARDLYQPKKLVFANLSESLCCGSALYFRTFARKEPYHKAGNWLCLYNSLFPGYSIQVKLESNKPPCTCSFFFQASHLALFIAFTAHFGPVSLDPSVREECYFQL